MADEIIPFGKYKGKPIEAMREDKSYCDWVVAQDWFRTRYANLFTIIVNNFGEPACTPEHNKLQALFLNDEFVCRVYDTVWTNSRTDYVERVLNRLHEEKVDEYNSKIKNLNHYKKELKVNEELLVTYKQDTYFERCIADYKKRIEEIENDISFLKDKINQKEQIDLPNCVCTFEVRGADVQIKCETGYSGSILRIEIKPTVSDDYPAVMREMKANECNVLYVGEYTGIGATQEQFVQIFKKSGIDVVFHHDFFSS